MTTAVPPLPPPHRLHDEAVEQLLASGKRRRELVAMLGEDGYRELSALARRAQDARRAGPLVYVLPGLMGSRIGTRGKLLDDVIWLDLIEVAAGHLTRLALPRGAKLAPLGVMLLNALKLKLSLQLAGFDARFHAYDWRLGIEVLARQLNVRIAAEGGREVLLIGHSMGGVVARVALASDPGHIARVVQLGAPNLGSYAPVLALRAVYPTVRKLAALDQHHDAEDLARIVFRTLPSLHELLPDPRLGGSLDLFDPAAWPDDTLRPERRLLDDAAAARERWPAADPRCLHIVGVRQETVTRAELSGHEFHYTVERAGDGTVPLRLATLPGAAHWYVAEKHGGLPNNGKVISAAVDLLRTGDTDRLPTSIRRSRAKAARVVTESVMRRVAPRKVRWQDLSADARRRLLEPVVSPEFHGAVAPAALRRPPATGPSPGARKAPRVLEIRLVHGSIADANARALVLGLFRNVDPSGAAAAVDERLDGMIREYARRRMFSASLGQTTSLPVARGTVLAEFIVLAGLGDFDDFGSDAQSFVAGNLVRMLAGAGVEDFATVLFGAGSGVPVAAALEQQLGGFVSGLADADPGHVVRRITICEIDTRKYASLRRAAINAARRLSDSKLRIIVDESEATPAEGPEARTPSRRPDARHRDPVYLVVTLIEQGRTEYECRSALLTAGAKAAVLSGTARVSRKELRAHLAKAESGQLEPRDMARFGAKLGRLLLAASVRDGLETMRLRPLVVVHDGEGSRVPWETLRIGDTHPALEGGLTRRYASESLTVARWREQRDPAQSCRCSWWSTRRSTCRAPTTRVPPSSACCARVARRSSCSPATRPLDTPCCGSSVRGGTTCCTTRDTDSSTRATPAAAASSARAARCCAARTSAAWATCRRWCSSMLAKRPGYASRAARPASACSRSAARPASPRPSSAAASRISSARTGRSATRRRSRSRRTSTSSCSTARCWGTACWPQGSGCWRSTRSTGRTTCSTAVTTSRWEARTRADVDRSALRTIQRPRTAGDITNRDFRHIRALDPFWKIRPT